jgi:signal transduction histidine kinase
MKKKYSILLIDDEESIVESLGYSLSNMGGFSVEVALSGDEGVQKFLDRKFDLVITDLMMGTKDGIQVLKEVKRLNPECPVVILTGHGTMQTAIEALAQGASDYLLKPCSSEELFIRTRRCLEQLEMKEKMERQSEDLAAVNEKLERNNTELENFASLASHDLQEPLRKISVYGSRLQTTFADNDDFTKKNIERILSAVDRMQNLIADLLSLSRATTKGGALKSVKLSKVVKDVLDTLEVRISQTQAKIHCKDLQHAINAYPTHIHQLLQNLIGNALKYHNEDIPPVVTVKSRCLENSFLEITVEDNGIGFDEKYVEKIFQPFERLHGRNEYEGTGMGLAICKKIVEFYGGTIDAKSEVGKGTQFIVTLPMKGEVD